MERYLGSIATVFHCIVYRTLLTSSQSVFFYQHLTLYSLGFPPAPFFFTKLYFWQLCYQSKLSRRDDQNHHKLDMKPTKMLIFGIDDWNTSSFAFVSVRKAISKGHCKKHKFPLKTIKKNTGPAIYFDNLDVFSFHSTW